MQFGVVISKHSTGNFRATKCIFSLCTVSHYNIQYRIPPIKNSNLVFILLVSPLFYLNHTCMSQMSLKSFVYFTRSFFCQNTSSFACHSVILLGVVIYQPALPLYMTGRFRNSKQPNGNLECVTSQRQTLVSSTFRCYISLNGRPLMQ